jgi:uncharacterized Zn finger protein (UPF0148 family)
MPTNDYFRCPACRAKLKFGKRPKSQVTCPSCGHKFEYQATADGAEPAAQNPLEPSSNSADPKEELGSTAAFGLALQEATKAPHPTDAEDEVDRIDDDQELPEYQTLARRPKAKNKSRSAVAEKPDVGDFSPTQKSRPTARAWKPNAMVIGLGSAGILMILFLITMAVVLFRGAGRASAKFEPPEKYVPLQVGFIIPLAGVMPEGWKSTSGGGGRDGPPIFAKISDGGSISIEIRESYVLKLMRLAGGRLPPLEEIHQYLREATKKNFSSYEEGPERPITTEGFQACVSDFSGKESLFSEKVKGCRASLVHAQHQYNVVCQCPAAQFEDVKPVFEKIISSLGTGEKR